MEDDSKKKHGGSGHHGHSQRPIDDVSEDTYSWWKKNYVLIKKTRVKTWRGVFVLAFIIGAAVALIWTISTNIHQFLKAEGETANMELSVVSEGAIIKDGTFDVDITVDSASQVVAARAIVTYVPEDVELVGCSTANSAFYVSTEPCLATKAESFRIVDNQPGVFDVTVAKPTPGTSSDGLVVARLTFKALRVASASSINLTFNHVSGQENYADSDVILDDRKGTDILNTATGVSVTIGSALCTKESYSYSEFGACQTGSKFPNFNGYRTRIVTGKIPADCVEGVPPEPLEEGCNVPPIEKPLCEPTSYRYSDWSACQVTNSRVRIVTAFAPPGCDQRNAVTSEACVYFDPNKPEPINPEGHEIDDPKIKVGDGDRVKLKKDKKFYSKEKKFSFKGKISGLEGGSVKAYVDGDLDEEVKLNSKGEWKYSKKGKEGKTYKVKFVYFNSKGVEVDDSAKYEIEVDTTKPKFSDLPLALNKRAGSKIWWKAEDDNGIDHFTVEFIGKKKETKDASFIVPAITPRGMHWMVVKAFDKAGNVETRRVMVRVR